MINPTPDDIRRDLEDAAQAFDREKVQDRLTPDARRRIVEATSVISDTLALAELQIDVDELREENARLRASLAGRDLNADAVNVVAAVKDIFARAVSPEATVSIQHTGYGWLVRAGNGSSIVRVHCGNSLEQAFADFSRNLTGWSF